MIRGIHQSVRSLRHDDKRIEHLAKAIPKTKPDQQDSVEEEPLSEVLWESTSKVREQVLQTYFIKGLNDGTVDPIKFGQYVLQDTVYCYGDKDNMDVAASKATGALQDFFLHESAFYETLYKDMFEAWSIADPKGIRLNTACQVYIDYITRVVKDKEDPVYFIVTLIPGFRLWPWIGEQFQKSGKSSGVYQKWVDFNMNPDHTGYLKLEEFINTSTSISKESAAAIYSECMKGELDFFGSIKDPSLCH